MSITEAFIILGIFYLVSYLSQILWLRFIEEYDIITSFIVAAINSIVYTVFLGLPTLGILRLLLFLFELRG